MWTDAIDKPTLILDPIKCRANIARMAERAQRNGVTFRPHAKTHQSATVAAWFREVGVQAITVSSVDMALYFANHGWKDILIAFTVNIRQMKDYNRLAGSGVKLGLIVESFETVKFLQERLEHKVHIWIDIDTGYHRTGIDWQETYLIVNLANAVCNAPKTMALAGLVGHPGHTYKATSQAQVEAIHQETVQRMNQIRDLLAERGINGLAISIGDTPSCSMVQDFGKVDEIRPGNFVFYDVMQTNIGANTLEDVAVAVCVPVIAKHPHLHQIVVYGGAVHLSKDRIVDKQGRTTFGSVAKATETGWEIVEGDCYVKGLSQEHGLIHADEALMNSVSVGDVLLILPVHSCLTANLLKKYKVLDGEIVFMAPIPRTEE